METKREKFLRLSDINLMQKCRIAYIDSRLSNYERLKELGFSENSVVIPLYRSLSGEPTAYSVWDTLIGLRREESDKIFVELEEES